LISADGRQRLGMLDVDADGEVTHTDNRRWCGWCGQIEDVCGYWVVTGAQAAG
jgi:hypothetical protein